MRHQEIKKEMERVNKTLAKMTGPDSIEIRENYVTHYEGWYIYLADPKTGDYHEFWNGRRVSNAEALRFIEGIRAGIILRNQKNKFNG